MLRARQQPALWRPRVPLRQVSHHVVQVSHGFISIGEGFLCAVLFGIRLPQTVMTIEFPIISSW